MNISRNPSTKHVSCIGHPISSSIFAFGSKVRLASPQLWIMYVMELESTALACLGAQKILYPPRSSTLNT